MITYEATIVKPAPHRTIAATPVEDHVIDAILADAEMDLTLARSGRGRNRRYEIRAHGTGTSPYAVTIQCTVTDHRQSRMTGRQGTTWRSSLTDNGNPTAVIGEALHWVAKPGNAIIVDGRPAFANERNRRYQPLVGWISGSRENRKNPPAYWPGSRVRAERLAAEISELDYLEKGLRVTVGPAAPNPKTGEVGDHWLTIEARAFYQGGGWGFDVTPNLGTEEVNERLRLSTKCGDRAGLLSALVSALALADGNGPERERYNVAESLIVDWKAPKQKGCEAQNGRVRISGNIAVAVRKLIHDAGPAIGGTMRMTVALNRAETDTIGLRHTASDGWTGVAGCNRGSLVDAIHGAWYALTNPTLAAQAQTERGEKLGEVVCLLDQRVAGYRNPRVSGLWRKTWDVAALDLAGADPPNPSDAYGMPLDRALRPKATTEPCQIKTLSGETLVRTEPDGEDETAYRVTDARWKNHDNMRRSWERRAKCAGAVTNAINEHLKAIYDETTGGTE